MKKNIAKVMLCLGMAAVIGVSGTGNVAQAESVAAEELVKGTEQVAAVTPYASASLSGYYSNSKTKITGTLSVSESSHLVIEMDYREASLAYEDVYTGRCKLAEGGSQGSHTGATKITGSRDTHNQYYYSYVKLYGYRNGSLVAGPINVN